MQMSSVFTVDILVRTVNMLNFLFSVSHCFTMAQWPVSFLFFRTPYIPIHNLVQQNAEIHTICWANTQRNEGIPMKNLLNYPQKRVNHFTTRVCGDVK
jgi:hypothetical protein